MPTAGFAESKVDVYYNNYVVCVASMISVLMSNIAYSIWSSVTSMCSVTITYMS